MAAVENRSSISAGIGRNSPLRELTRGPIEYGVTFLHSKLPEELKQAVNLADLFTAYGLLATVIGSIKTIRLNGRDISETDIEERILPAAALITGALADAFDGPMARLERKEMEKKGEDVRKKASLGPLKDAMADRLGTLVKGLSRAVSAHQRGDITGEYAAYANVVTSSFSSIARAKAESQLLENPENGRDPLEFAGNHVGRSTLDTISTAHPFLKIFGMKIHIQSIFDSLSAVGTVKVADSRLKNGKPIDKVKFKEKLEEKMGKIVTEEEIDSTLNKVRTDAIERGKAMSMMAAVSIVAVVVTHETLRGRNPIFSFTQAEPTTVFERSGSR